MNPIKKYWINHFKVFAVIDVNKRGFEGSIFFIPSLVYKWYMGMHALKIQFLVFVIGIIFTPYSLQKVR